MEHGELVLIELAVDVPALCQEGLEAHHIAEAHLQTRMRHVRAHSERGSSRNNSVQCGAVTLARILPGLKSTVLVATAPARSGYGGATDAPWSIGS